MTSPVTSTSQSQPVAQSAPVNQKLPEEAKITSSKPQPATKDVVQISAAARAALTEATETAAQTSKEAQSGDHQAQRILAKQAAAKAR